jgi:hypothetical protein
MGMLAWTTRRSVERATGSASSRRSIAVPTSRGFRPLIDEPRHIGEAQPFAAISASRARIRSRLASATGSP